MTSQPGTAGGVLCVHCPGCVWQVPCVTLLPRVGREQDRNLTEACRRKMCRSVDR